MQEWLAELPSWPGQRRPLRAVPGPLSSPSSVPPSLKLGVQPCAGGVVGGGSVTSETVLQQGSCSVSPGVLQTCSNPSVQNKSFPPPPRKPFSCSDSQTEAPSPLPSSQPASPKGSASERDLGPSRSLAPVSPLPVRGLCPLPPPPPQLQQPPEGPLQTELTLSRSPGQTPCRASIAPKMKSRPHPLGPLAPAPSRPPVSRTLWPLPSQSKAASSCRLCMAVCPAAWTNPTQLAPPHLNLGGQVLREAALTSLQGSTPSRALSCWLPHVRGHRQFAHSLKGFPPSVVTWGQWLRLAVQPHTRHPAPSWDQSGAGCARTGSTRNRSLSVREAFWAGTVAFARR